MVLIPASAHAWRTEDVAREQEALDTLLLTPPAGESFPGSGHRPENRKRWMQGLEANNVRVNQVVWPGTHNSATNGIGIIGFIDRPFAQCQTLSIYDQLALGCRVLDVRVEIENSRRRVCHGSIMSYSVDVVLNDVKRFLAETTSEIIILEIRTEHGHQDPPEFDQFLVQELGAHLIWQNDRVFNMTIAELSGRVICVWKPRQSPPPNPGGPLWNKDYLKDHWIDTDLPKTKFDSNLSRLSREPPVSRRGYFYRVENTLTAQADNLVASWTVEQVTPWIHSYARLFISQVFDKGHGDKLQIFSTDFIDEDFVNACVGVTKSRLDAGRGA